MGEWFKKLRKRLADRLWPEYATLEYRHMLLTQLHEGMQAHRKWMRTQLRKAIDNADTQRGRIEYVKTVITSAMKMLD